MSEWKVEKPLGHKSYGSIPHLPGSRLGSGDHCVNEGQNRILTERLQVKNSRIVVQEKLDGSNVAVARIGDTIIALGRAGYPAQSSKYEMHQRFAAWVRVREHRFFDLLADGERVCGEWMAQAHGTIYEPLPSAEWLFRPFDIMRGAIDRQPYDLVRSRVIERGFVPVETLSVGDPLPIASALALLAVRQSVRPADGSLGEGCVWREERQREGEWYVNQLAKYVRPDKVDGQYLDGPPVWQEVKP